MQVRFEFTAASFAACYRAAILRLRTFRFVLATVAALGVAAAASRRLPIVAAFVVMALTPVIVLFVAPRSMFKRSPTLKGPQSASFETNSIVTSAGGKESRILWSNVEDAAETPKAWLIRVKNTVMLMMPHDAVADPDGFRALLREKGKLA